MTLFSSVLLFLFALFCDWGLCEIISLTVTNPEVLFNREVSHRVHVTITISQSEKSKGQRVQLFSESVENITTASRLCLHLNGKPCNCVTTDETHPISEVVLVASDSCIRQTRGFWSSVSVSCAGALHASSKPLYIPPQKHKKGQERDEKDPMEQKITLVLPLHMADIPRAKILLKSLQQLDQSLVHMFYIVVPDSQKEMISNQLYDEFTALMFLSEVKKQSELFDLSALSLESKIDGYVLQMAIKLWVVNIVETDYYITLDADVILLRKFNFQDVIICDVSEIGEITMKRGIYENEPRDVHINWWIHSSKLLNFGDLDEDYDLSVDLHDGFGVTPAVMSVWGSHILIDRLQNVYGKNMVENVLLERFKMNIWTEYTMYALLLYEYGVFDSLHIEHDTNNRKILHCNDVWYDHQLPWNAKAAYENNKCLFSIVQSTSNAEPAHILQQMLEDGKWMNDAAISVNEEETPHGGLHKEEQMVSYSEEL